MPIRSGGYGGSRAPRPSKPLSERSKDIRAWRAANPNKRTTAYPGPGWRDSKKTTAVSSPKPSPTAAPAPTVSKMSDAQVAFYRPSATPKATSAPSRPRRSQTTLSAGGGRGGPTRNTSSQKKIASLRAQIAAIQAKRKS
jgi:hypothetical protein